MDRLSRDALLIYLSKESYYYLFAIKPSFRGVAAEILGFELHPLNQIN